MTVIFCAAIMISFVGLVAMAVFDTDEEVARSANQRFLESLKDQVQVSEDPEPKCSVSACEVTCEDVDESYVVEEILNLNLEDSQCSFIELLKLDGCTLASDGIQKDFLSSLNIEVKKLEIVNSNVKYIMVEAFNSNVFGGVLASLKIENSRSEPSTLLLFAEQVFEGLTSLTSMEIQNLQMLETIDKHSLQRLKDSLTTLKIKNIVDPWNPGDLLEKVAMKKLSLVELSSNNIKSLEKVMFSGITSCVTSLELQSSKIETININTFEDFEKLKKLYLQYNNIVYIDANIFNNLLTINGFNVNLQNNLLNCICEMLPLKEMILANMAAFSQNLMCNAPEEWNRILLIEADVCHLETTTEEETSTTETEETTTTEITTTTIETTTTPATTTETTTLTSTNEPSTSETTTEATTEEQTTTTEEQTTTTEEQTTTVTTPEPPTTRRISTTLTKTETENTSTEENTTEETTLTLTDDPGELHVVCYRDKAMQKSSNKSHAVGSHASYSIDDSLDLNKSPIVFSFEESLTESEVQISFADYYDEVFLLYYPGVLDTSDLDAENVRDSVQCTIVSVSKVVIIDLLPSTVYTFCALFPDEAIESPFQCKSFATKDPLEKKLYAIQEHKAMVVTVALVIALMSLLIGAVMTYFMIRKMPTLMKGSKRVVMVHSQSKEVMVMPSSSRASSIQKESNSCENNNDAPIYLTPRPRQSMDFGNNRPPFVRSSSDESLGARSYISVSKCPPRFSQVFQPGDFTRELPKRCESLSHSRDSHHSPGPMPPPLPRRSIASTTSTVDMRKPSKNSICRHSRICGEMEDHYNIII